MTTFGAKDAVVLLQQAIIVFNSVSDPSLKFRMAEAVDTLREALPTLIPDGKSTEDFLRYVDFVQNEIIKARHMGISATTTIAPLLCLNNVTGTSCGGPPNKPNYCVVCNKRGGKL